MSWSDLTLRASPLLARPRVALTLFVGCALATAPMYFNDALYHVLGADTPSFRWWHLVETRFVHGGGFPGTTAHLAINGAILLLFGVPLERLLGSGRLFTLLVSTTAATALAGSLLHRHANGISGTAWGTVALAAPLLVAIWRRDARRAARDPLTWLASLLALVAALGMAVMWHAVSVVAALPLALLWRKTLAENYRRFCAAEAPDLGDPSLGTVGAAVAFAVVAMVGAITAAGVLGRLA